MVKVRYPSLTWFQVSNLNITCDIPTWLGIPDPPAAQSAPYQYDEENIDARPDQEEMEKAINKFLQQLEKQEKKGFKDLATLLSHWV